MSQQSEVSRPEEISEAALREVAIFPLPGTVLLPHTFLSLHIFEPRYRRMMADLSEGHRIMAVALLNPAGGADAFERPAIHPIAGVGALRRSARLPDGRYNIVLEGLLRVDLSDELPPDLPYRRARARVIPDDLSGTSGRELAPTVASVRALYGRLLGQSPGADPEMIQRLNEVTDPSALAHVIAAASLTEASDRQRILEEPNVEKRLELAAALLGSILLRNAEVAKEPGSFGWGVGPAKA